MKSVLLNQCARLVLALCVSLIIHKGVSIPYAIGETGSLEYTLKLEDKTVVDSNVGGGPLTYIHGSHQIIPGLEKALEGMKIGDIKEVTVKPEEGYGAGAWAVIVLLTIFTRRVWLCQLSFM